MQKEVGGGWGSFICLNLSLRQFFVFYVFHLHVTI